MAAADRDAGNTELERSGSPVEEHLQSAINHLTKQIHFKCATPFVNSSFHTGKGYTLYGLESDCEISVLGDAVTVSVMDGDKVTLHTDITKKVHDKMLWYFEDTRIALINGHPNTSCLYDGEGGRFRDRLKVDYKTGSLIITNITTEHAGRYEAEIIRSESSGKRQSLNRNRKCNSTKITKKISINQDDTIKTFNMIVNSALSDQVKTIEESRMEKREFDLDSGLSSAAVAGICAAAVLLLTVVAAAGVIYSRCKFFNAERKKNKHEGIMTI